MFTLQQHLRGSIAEGAMPISQGEIFDLGSGYDSLTDEHFPVIIAEPNDPAQPFTDTSFMSGQSVLRFSDVIEDIYSFREMLNISASAALHGFGGRASARYSLSREIKINTYDVYALIYISVLNATRSLRDPKLSRRAHEEWNAQKSDLVRKQAFLSAFGDSYVSSITTGGEFFALMVLHADSRSEHQAIQQAASAGFSAAKVSGSYQQIIDVVQKHTHSTFKMYRNGGAPTPAENLKAILEYVGGFEKSVDPSKGGTPAPILFSVMPARKIADANTNINLDQPDARDAIIDLAELHDVAEIRLGDAQFIQSHPSLFPNVSAEDAQGLSDAFEGVLTKIERMADAIARGRFDNQKISLLTKDSIPDVPQVPVGQNIPITVHVVDGPGHNLEEANGGWLSFPGLKSMMCDCDLGTGAQLQYSVGVMGGWQAKTPAGYSTPHTNYGAWGIEFEISGPDSERFVVEYAVRFAFGSAIYYSKNGRKLETSDRDLITGLKIKIYRSS